MPSGAAILWSCVPDWQNVMVSVLELCFQDMYTPHGLYTSSTSPSSSPPSSPRRKFASRSALLDLAAAAAGLDRFRL